MLHQYNNIYTSLHKYLLKKKHKPITGKKKKKTIAIVAIVPLGTVVTIQNLGKRKKKKWLTKPKHCSYSDLAHSRFYIYRFIFSYDWSQFHILLFYFDL